MVLNRYGLNKYFRLHIFSIVYEILQKINQLFCLMIKHIVFWRLNENAYGNNKQTNAQLLKEKLLAMTGKVEGLLKIEVGFDFSNEKDSCDVVLYSEFTSKDALHQYQVHPQHEDIKKWLSEVRYERRVVDYEV
jgi:predicted glycosyltransferase involved in capsule biosynthesis